MTGLPDHPFWHFSLRVYGTDGVVPACLALQERHGLDVNLLLFCCWLGHARAAPLTRADFARIASAVAPWHRDVVRPLRAVRRRLKEAGPAVPADQAEALRQGVKRIELDAEHIEQLALAAALPPAGPAPGPMPANAATALGIYLESLNIYPDETDRTQLSTVLAAAFPEAAAPDLAGLVAGLRGA